MSHYPHSLIRLLGTLLLLLAACGEVPSGDPTEDPGPGGAGGTGNTGGSGSKRDECDFDSQCDDGNDCTDDVCANREGVRECFHDPLSDNECSEDGVTGVCDRGRCEPAVGMCQGILCDDGNPCTEDGVCDPTTGRCPAPSFARAGDRCEGGTCDGEGACVPICDDRLCFSGDPCVGDGVCDPVHGGCIEGDPMPAETLCNDGGGRMCDGAGTCVECTESFHCPVSDNECVRATCNGNGVCDFEDLVGTSCTYEGVPGAGLCSGGTCMDAGRCEDETCDDGNECSLNRCDPSNGFCGLLGWQDDGTPCEGGVCMGGQCGTVFPCTEAGIRAAVAFGGGPLNFACEGRTTVRTAATIDIPHGVILDGRGELIVDAQGGHRVFSISSDEPVELRRLTVRGGYAASFGGAGIYHSTEASGPLTLAECVVTDNRSESRAGGILWWGRGKLTLQDTTVSDNHAETSGAGVLFGPAEGELEVIRSTISGNSSGERGGGIYVASNQVTLMNSTVSGNRAGELGGGVFNAAELDVIACTIWNNEAPTGASLLNVGEMTMTSTLLSTGCAGSAPWDGEYNIEVGGDTCSAHAAPAGVGPLRGNGGPTATHHPDAGVNPLVDYIPSSDCRVTEDQRGRPRNEGEGCDVGAVERQCTFGDCGGGTGTGGTGGTGTGGTGGTGTGGTGGTGTGGTGGTGTGGTGGTGTGGTGGTGTGGTGTGGTGGTPWGCTSSAACEPGEVCNEQNECVPALYELRVAKSGEGTGTVTAVGITCGADCRQTVHAGTTVVLTASASSGSELDRFTGCDSTSGNRCTVTVNRNTTITVTFDELAPETIALSAPSTSNNGSFTLSWTTDRGGATWYVQEAPTTAFSNPTVYTKDDFVAPYTYSVGNKPAGQYCYRVGRGPTGPFSDPTCVTVTTPAQPKLQVRNESSFMIVSLRLDGEEQVPDGYAWEPGTDHNWDITGPATVSYRVGLGFWDNLQRTERFYFPGTVTVGASGTTTLRVGNPTLGQILTNFSNSKNWRGSYFDANNDVHFAHYNFRSNGSWTFYDDNVQRATGQATLVRWPVYANPVFKLCSTCAEIILPTPYVAFYFRNGPQSWPTIEYVQQ